MKHFSLLLSLLLFMASGNPVHSATWNVNNLTDLQTRLTEAQNNGQDDTINVAAGIYNVATTLTYLSAEANTLAIQGASAATTRLDGGGSLQLMNVDTSGGGGSANVTIRNLTFRNGNNAAGNGGGLNIVVDGAVITVESCIFTNNTASGFGGAVRMNASSNGTVYFENNSVGGINSAGASGGAVHVNSASGGTLYIRDNSITGTNTSLSSGGALYANTSSNGTSVISGNTVSGTNTGTRGGGIYANTSSNSSLTISNNTISGTNTTTSSNGGAIYANTGDASTITFSGNTIYGNNSSFTDGGGAAINGGTGTTIYVFNNTISGTNSASTDGGGMRVNAPLTGTLYLVNNTVTGNSATNNGGGVFIPSSGTAHIYNNIIRDNSADNGDDLYVDASDTTPVNLFNNLLGPNVDFIAANSEDLVVDNITNYSQGSNITGNPLLGPLQNNGGSTFTRALPSNSPAVNAGDNGIIATLALTYDQRGYQRITGGTVDIGAYEFGVSVAVPTMTEWGIIIFIVLAGLGATYYLRRQKTAKS